MAYRLWLIAYRRTAGECWDAMRVRAPSGDPTDKR
jgi:hypothetical protein